MRRTNFFENREPFHFPVHLISDVLTDPYFECTINISDLRPEGILLYEFKGTVRSAGNEIQRLAILYGKVNTAE